MQAQLAPAVPPEGKHRDRLRDGSGVRKELLHKRIHPMRVLPERLTAALAPFGGGDELAPGDLEPLRADVPRIGRQVDGKSPWVAHGDLRCEVARQRKPSSAEHDTIVW